MRASVRRGLDLALLPLEKPKMTMPGQVGVVELVDRLGALVDEDVPVAVDHPVGVLAVGGPGPGLLDHQHLGLDVQGGVALRAPDHLEGQRHHGGPEQDDEEGHDPGGPPTVAVAARPVRPRRGRPPAPTTATASSRAAASVGPDGHLAPLAVERDADGQPR